METAALIAEIRSAPSTSGFCLDFDGTLSEIVSDPEDARPVAGAVEVLEALSRRYAVVVLISGRNATGLRDAVGAEGPAYVGLYGAETLVGGRLEQSVSAERWRTMASRLARDAQAFLTVEGLSGSHVEYKDLAVSIHYRMARAGDAAGETIARWAEVAAPRRGFTANRGRKVIELRPAGVSKSEAVMTTIRDKGLKRVVIAGDDSADVEAMRAARTELGEGCLTIGVHSQEVPAEMSSAASVLLSGPTEVVEFLGRFL